MQTNNPTLNELSIAEEFPKGTKFTTIQEFNNCFSISALEKGIGFMTKRHNAQCIAFACKHAHCTFKVSARYVMSESQCVIKHMNPFHTCTPLIGKQRKRGIIKKVLLKLDVSELTPKLLISKMRTDYQCKVPYTTAWSAIKATKKAFGMILENSYSLIPSLVKNIRANGDIAEYTYAQDRTFERFFMMWNASKEFFIKSRKLLYIDGTFLSGPNKGTLLVAVSLDSCDQLVLIAVAVVESQNSASWNWFIGLIDSNMEINDPSVVLFLDHEKGIINAVNQLVPLCAKAYCARHIAKNLKKNFRDNIAMSYYWRSVNTYSIEEFNDQMNKLSIHNQSFHQKLISIGVERLANSMFPIPRYGKTTKNPIESAYSTLKKFIGHDISTMIISINNYVMETYNERRQKRFISPIVDNCLKILNRNITQGRLLNIKASNNDMYLVDQKYMVNLLNKNCECKEAVSMGIPCKHVCSVLRKKHIDPISFVAKSYSTETYYSQFARNILPLSSIDLTRSDITAPLIRRTRGRPKIRRNQKHWKINLET